MADRGPLGICAIIAVRNEVRYLKVLLPLLARQGIDVAIIDNDSTDGSRDLYSGFTGNPIISVDDLPYRGCFSLSEQLAAKQRVADGLRHDWVIHHDADEVLEHRLPGRTLRDAIEEAHDAGHDVVNFEEFVFLPQPGSVDSVGDHYREILRYYFFEPKKNRLNRAWNRSRGFRNAASGGHAIEGTSKSIAPNQHNLRHYIALSERHAQMKYESRRFDQAELSRGWHRNRVGLTNEALRIPHAHPLIFELDSHESKDLRRSSPTAEHYWAWQS